MVSVTSLVSPAWPPQVVARQTGPHCSGAVGSAKESSREVVAAKRSLYKPFDCVRLISFFSSLDLFLVPNAVESGTLMFSILSLGSLGRCWTYVATAVKVGSVFEQNFDA